MPELRFNIPRYPHLKRFSDPYVDFEDEAEQAALAEPPPDSLSYMDLLTIFNTWLPIGTFEEMAPYVPRALELIRRSADENDAEAGQMLEHLINWCYVEQEAMKRDPAFLRGMQEAMMTLFHHWSQQLARKPQPQAEAGYELRHHYLMETLLFHGDECHDIQRRTDAHFHREPRPAIPWLASTHYQPLLTALDSVPHAAWTLLCSEKSPFCTPRRLNIPADTLRRALNMVEDWLLSGSATAEDFALWDPVTTRHWTRLRYYPGSV